MAEEKNVQEEERPELRLIPDNFMNSGRMFNGMIETRNFFEAIGVCAVLGGLEFLLFTGMGFSELQKWLIIIISVGPFAIAALVGINGDSLTQFLKLFFNFMKNKRKLRYRRIMKNPKSTGSRVKARPTNKTSRTKRK